MLSTVSGSTVPLRADTADAGLQYWNGGNLPSFILPSSGGENIALENARGRAVLVHFFATWCEPCKEELPALDRLAKRATGAATVLAISVAEVDTRVHRFLETMPLTFPVLLDRDRAITRTWNVSILPTTFVLDANLHPRLVVESDFSWDTIDIGKLNDMLTSVPTQLELKTRPMIQTPEDDHALR
jgi:peroxiredoxin